MLKFFKKNLLAVIACAYSLVVALFWLALRVNWSGISKALGADKNPTFFVMETPLGVHIPVAGVCFFRRQPVCLETQIALDNFSVHKRRVYGVNRGGDCAGSGRLPAIYFAKIFYVAACCCRLDSVCAAVVFPACQ